MGELLAHFKGWDVQAARREGREEAWKEAREVVGILLNRLNISDEEVDAFTAQIKERKMGELLAHFKGWDVQAIRKESREEGIEKLVKAMNVVIDSKETAMRQLVTQYDLSEEEAAEKVEMYWQS